MPTDYMRVFPASITNDWGRVLTEKNIKSILGFIASSRAVVSGFALTPTQLTTVADGLVAAVSSGKAIFDGYQMDFTYSQYNIPFPAGITTGEYYICLRTKFTTGANSFIEYKNFTDLPNGFDVDCPFVVIQSAIENIPDDTLKEAGYTYCYLPLYKLIYTNGTLSSGPLDIRSRVYLNTDKISLGYIDDNLANYFLFDTTDSTTGLEDWKKKTALSKHGELKSVEQLLYEYIDFIHTVVRGYKSLSTITTGDPTKILWDTESSDAENGDGPLPIINQTTPEDSIVRRLKYTINGVRDFINGRIVLPSAYNGDGSVTYTPANYNLGYLLTLDNEKLLNRIFLPKASTTNTGIVQITEAFTADNDSSYLDTKVLSVDSDGKLKARGPRYAIAHIKYKALDSTPTATAIDIVSNNSNMELDAGQNIQLSATTTDKYNPIIKIAVYGTIGLAYGIQYDAGVDPTTFPGNTGKTYYVLNQNLKKTDNVQFAKITLTDQIVVPTITGGGSGGALAINGNTTITGNTTVSGELTAALVHNAGHNDIAELFRKGANTVFEPGDIIAKIPGKNAYQLASQDNSYLVVGVYSDTYGQILGGDEKSIEENLKDYLPIGVSGRVRVKIIGPIMEGDLITISPVNGVGMKIGRKSYIPGTVIGKALETKDEMGIGRIEMIIALM